MVFVIFFDHSYVRMKQNVSFRYRNKLKIRPKKRIGFMHVDITIHNAIISKPKVKKKTQPCMFLTSTHGETVFEQTVCSG
jgi:hypothetical protein